MGCGVWLAERLHHSIQHTSHNMNRACIMQLQPCHTPEQELARASIMEELAWLAIAS